MSSPTSAPWEPRHLRNPALFRERCYVNAEWCEAESGLTLRVKNPATGCVIGSVPRLDVGETRRAVAAASAALPTWASRTAKNRTTILGRWHDLLLANLEDLACLVTAEQGKPLAAAMGEVAAGASYVEWFGEEARRVYAEQAPAPRSDRQRLVLLRPVGVCGALTPWQFPSALVTRKVAPALAAGCTVVLKPAAQTPFSALALAALADEAGVPPGVLNIVTGPTGNIARELTANPNVRRLTFAGSTEIGYRLQRAGVDAGAKITVDRGGQAALLIFDDADLAAAVQGALRATFRSAAQPGIAVNRLLIQRGIYDAFAAQYAAAAQALQVGPGIEPTVEVGPLIDETAVRTAEGRIADAVEQGATVVTGGRRHARGGRFFEPTVLGHAAAHMRIARAESCGVVMPLIPFGNEEEAVALANESGLGLASYFFTRDVGRVYRVAQGLATGIFGVNAVSLPAEAVPFGVTWQSGPGPKGYHDGIRDFLETKHIYFAEASHG